MCRHSDLPCLSMRKAAEMVFPSHDTRTPSWPDDLRQARPDTRTGMCLGTDLDVVGAGQG